MRIERPQHQVIDPNPLGSFGARENLCVVDSPVAILVELGAQPHGLRSGSGDFEIAALDDVGVDTFAAGHVDHLVDGLVEHPLPGDDAVPPVSLGQQISTAGCQAGQPAAVAPGGAKPGESRFQHSDAQGWIGLLEVIGGPQPGVAGPDDADVGFAISGQGGSRVG